MRVLVLALCTAACAAFIPASSALAWSGPGDVHQSNRNTQVVVVNNQGAQSAGLISGPIVIPINSQIGLNLNHVLSGLNILGNGGIG